MGLKKHPATSEPPAKDALLQEMLGYLNFSGGKPDAAFQRNLNRLYKERPAGPFVPEVRRRLVEELDRLHRTSPAFADCQQAEAAIRLTLNECLPAYRRFHADLLFHLNEEDFEQPFLLARMFEAVLEQGGPWDETERILGRALDRLNDFIGYRPLAVLENDRKMEPYPHERFRPVPLYIAGAGIAFGRYHDLIERTLALLQETPGDILRDTYFDPSLMDELALDMRAHDHMHPANKRTNYMFGEWDPHLLDNQGRYRRFILRKIILDALLNWIASHPEVQHDELLSDAAAVLCGTMLMASSVSGSGPDTHDSSVTLTSLLPRIARQRDAFYERLLREAKGERARRLRREAQLTQQPFGHVRQVLNIELARYGARQVQYWHLSRLFARMGYPEASREQAAVIPAAAIRFETEIQWRIATVHGQLDRGDLDGVPALVREIEDHLHRGIECGALTDPWNILGFQGQFPLFTSREDSVPDPRAEVLLEMMDETFAVYSRALSEAAAQGNVALHEELAAGFRQLAEEWDRYATTVIEDLPRVSGAESYESASHVARALSEWRAAGEAAGDISFWREHVEQFESAKAYAQVVEALLDREDQVASMGLLMQWLGQADEVGLEAGPHSLYVLLVRWMHLAAAAPNGGLWRSLRRLFDFLEANAGEFWNVPTLAEAADRALLDELTNEELAEGAYDDEFDEEDESDEEDLFGAAYDNVIYRDSAQDGQFQDTLDGGFAPENTEFELITRQLEPRLKFLATLAELWQTAAATLAVRNLTESADDREQDERTALVLSWHRRTIELQKGLTRLMEAVEDYEIPEPMGDYDSNVEYDIQLQMKLYLLHTIIMTGAACRTAERFLLCCLPPQPLRGELARDRAELIEVHRGILRGDAATVRRALPRLLDHLARKPLLYVSLENDGDPRQVLAARTLQTVIRFLLAQLPRLGLLRETWQVLRTAYRMERSFRPDGLAVTEFDRLFRIALRSTLECVGRSATQWKEHPAPAHRALWTVAPSRRRTASPRRLRRPSSRNHRGNSRFAASRRPSPGPTHHTVPRRGELTPSDEHLVKVFGEIVERYSNLWLKHSGTMRLSVVEGMKPEHVWQRVKMFIARYGADLLHARMLMLGNVRAILHYGIEPFLEHLDETEDPLHPVRLLDDLERGLISREEVVDLLELIYGAVVDKFDRFLEYNTTTTQSDYGEKFFCLLDVLRVEAGYERDAWNFTPVALAHEVLTDLGRDAAALTWEQVFEARTRDVADGHLAALRQLEKVYGMKLPSVTDRLNERFVKPLAVNRMLALVPRAMDDARFGRRSESFARLRREIDAYLESISGSSIDVPGWLRSLERAVDQTDPHTAAPPEQREPEAHLPQVRLTLRQTERQLTLWDEPLRRSTRGRNRGE